MKHTIDTMMAMTWDPGGRGLPREWFWICSCGERDSGLKDQVVASDSWRAHRDRAEAEELLP